MDFSKRDILNALGIETETNFWTVALAGFGVGCLVGAAVAIMVAPKSGRELREDIMERGRDLMGRAKETFESQQQQGMNVGKNPITPTY